jgi:hypothetical protein
VRGRLVSVRERSGEVMRDSAAVTDGDDRGSVAG